RRRRDLQLLRQRRHRRALPDPVPRAADEADARRDGADRRGRPARRARRGALTGCGSPSSPSTSPTTASSAASPPQRSSTWTPPRDGRSGGVTLPRGLRRSAVPAAILVVTALLVAAVLRLRPSGDPPAEDTAATPVVRPRRYPDRRRSPPRTSSRGSGRRWSRRRTDMGVSLLPAFLGGSLALRSPCGAGRAGTAGGSSPSRSC